MTRLICAARTLFLSRWSIGVALAAGALIGGSDCGVAAAAANPPPAAVTKAHFSLLPQTAAAGQSILAQINGENLSASAFHDTLTHLYGLNLFQQWLQIVLLQQACQREGLHVTAGDINGEENKLLAQLKKQHVPQDQLHAALTRVLAARGITMPEFRLSLWRNAYIHALAHGHIHVTKEQIKDAYNVNFGPKIKAVDIVVNSFDEAVTVHHLIMQQHRDPEQIARVMSIDKQTARNGGVVLIPLKDPALPKLFIDTARSLKPGKLSAAIPLGTTFHLLWLLDNIPAQNVPLAKVRPIIVKKLTAALENQWGARTVSELWQQAKIKIHNPVLDAQYQAARSALLARLAKEKAASPGSAPAPSSPAKIPTAQ